MHADGRTDMTNLIKSGTSVDFIKDYGIITFSIISHFYLHGGHYLQLTFYYTTVYLMRAWCSVMVKALRY